MSHIEAKFYASDHWHAYNLIDPAKLLTGKSHTYTVERMSRLLRHGIAKF
jgi:IS1 family transposase